MNALAIYLSPLRLGQLVSLWSGEPSVLVVPLAAAVTTAAAIIVIRPLHKQFVQRFASTAWRLGGHEIETKGKPAKVSNTKIWADGGENAVCNR